MSFPYKLLLLLGLLGFDVVRSQLLVNTPLVTSGLDQGMFTSTVRKIIKDKNGFLWLATQDGLHKYDGNVTTLFTKDNTNPKRSLLGTDCYDMEYEPGEDFLYILSSYEGLNVINIQTNQIVHQTLSEELAGSKTPTFYEHMARLGHQLIITTVDRHFAVYNTITKKVDKYDNIDVPAILSIQNLFVYGGRPGIILSDNTLAYFDIANGNIIRSIACSHELAGLVITMSLVSGNEIWMATDRGIYAANLQNGQHIDIALRLPGFPPACFKVNTFMMQQADNLMVIANNNGLFVYDTLLHQYIKLFTSKSEDDNKLLASARSILFTNGQLWIGGPYGIAQVKQLKPVFTPIGKSAKKAILKIGQPYGLSINNGLLFVAAEDGAYKINTISNTIERLVANQLFFSTGCIGDIQVLLSGVNELLIYKNGRVQNADKVYKELTPIVKEYFISIKQLAPNKILLASQLKKALYLWDMQLHTLKSFNTLSELPIADLSFNNLLVVNEDSVFAVSETIIQLIDFKHSTTKVVFKLEQLGKEKSGVFMDMCRQGRNYWVAGYGLGIIKLNDQFKLQEWLKTKNGINNLGLYKIFNVDDSLIVATSNSGLICYNSRQKKLRTYYGADGLQSGSFNEASGCQQGDSIYVGGLNGVSLFNAKNYCENNAPPKLYFNTLSYETPAGTKDTTNLFVKDFEVPDNVTQTKISFTGLNYLNPHRVQYAYRITELNESWTDLKTQNFVPLIGISPGTYTLEVKAANEDGVECVAISMTLHFQPKWYQTWLFKLIVILGIAAIFYALYRYRLSQLKARDAIRRKLASDLHDDLGSTLTSIRIFTDLAMRQNPKDFLQQIKQGIQDAMTATRDMIWVMDRSRNSAAQLAEKINGFALPLANANNVIFEIQVDKELSSLVLQSDEQRNLYLIAKEFITNSLKYAGCKKITFTITKHGKRVSITITDDGTGFDIYSVKRGKGLTNMESRAIAIHYKAFFYSSTGSGTTLQLVPIKRLFLKWR